MADAAPSPTSPPSAKASTWPATTPAAKGKRARSLARRSSRLVSLAAHLQERRYEMAGQPPIAHVGRGLGFRAVLTREQLADRLRGVGDHPLVDFSGVRAQYRHGDRVFVYVESDVYNPVHYRSLRLSAPQGLFLADDPRIHRNRVGHLMVTSWSGRANVLRTLHRN